MRYLAALLAVAAVLAVPAVAPAAPVPADAMYSEAYFDTPEGFKMHADVFRPKGVAATEKLPVVMVVSPYTGHSAPTGTNFDPQASGPSSRFFDFANGAKLFTREHRYTFVVVDLPGFGGSGGCTDWGGPNEQNGVRYAVEWGAAQPWSNGKVGLYGKSYDGWTGLMGIAQHPKGLAAVVAQEPVYSGYDYLYMDGIRFGQSLTMGETFGVLNLQPGTVNDTTDYHVNGAPTAPWCVGVNAALHQNDNKDAGFWQVRELAPAVRGATTPLFLTQGFLEDNTKPDGAFEFFDNMAGPKRAWFGEFDHVRGNDMVGSGASAKPAMGRSGWFDEVMSFYDQYLLGIEPAVQYPPVALQDGSGKWRTEQQWPPADSHRLVTELKTGTYADDGNNAGTGANGGKGIWTISPPLDYDVHFSGEPAITVDASAALPNANLVADVYAIDPAGKATLISRGGKLIRSSGIQTITLYGNDWPVAKGSRLGVLITGANSEWFTHVPTRQTVTVNAARIALPFLRHKRSYDLQGISAAKLNSWKSSAPFVVPAATIAAATAPFALPDPLEPTG